MCSPQIAVDRHVAGRQVVGDRHARQLDDAAFDRVHQREVADRPGEQRTFGIARAAQEEGGRGEIVDGAQAELPLDDLDAGDPEPRGLVVLLGLVLVLALQVLLVAGIGLLAVAVVRLVVEDDDALHAHQLGHDALEHLSLALERVQRLAAALQQRAPNLGDLHPLAQLEGVIVGDDDLRLVHVGQHVRRHQLAMAVVAFGVIGQEDPQAITDRDPGRDDQETATERLAARVAHGIERMPGDQHRHHGGLARPGGHLEGEPHERRIRLLVGAQDVLPEFFGALAELRRDLGQPDDRLDRFDLAEERANRFEAVVPPMLQQARGRRRDLPVVRVWQTPPGVDVVPDLVDDRGRVVLLLGIGEIVRVREDHLPLIRRPPLALARLGNRRDQRRAATPLKRRSVGWLPICVELVVPGRDLVRRVEDGLLEECLNHALAPCRDSGSPIGRV